MSPNDVDLHVVSGDGWICTGSSAEEPVVFLVPHYLKVVPLFVFPQRVRVEPGPENHLTVRRNNPAERSQAAHEEKRVKKKVKRKQSKNIGPWVAARLWLRF